MEEQHERKRLQLSGPGEPDLEPPLVDGYEIIKPIGEGGMGVVWNAKQLSTNREVALKVINQFSIRSRRRAKIRFEREVTIAARLEHPNIARIYESGIHKNHCFYAMEIIHGQMLDEYVRNQNLSVRETLQLMHKVCEAVQYAHQQGVIHRDLKHSNIMVTPDGQPHVLDFGLARDLLENDQERKISLDGEVIGTPDFMSPEQAAGDIEAVDTRSDVYSLGVILYNLLTGKWPHDTQGRTYDVLRAIHEDEPIRPSALTPRFNRDLEAILLKTLAKRPHERYRSAGELADDLDNWLHDRPISIKSSSAVYVLQKLARKHKYASAVLLLVISIIISSSVACIYWYLRASASEQMIQMFSEGLDNEEQAFKEWVRDDLFLDFMRLWQAGQLQEAQRYSALLSQNSMEDLAAKYLLRKDNVDETRLRKELTSDSQWFADLIIAENYLKNGDKDRAVRLAKDSIAKLELLLAGSKSDRTRLLLLWGENRAQYIVAANSTSERER